MSLLVNTNTQYHSNNSLPACKKALSDNDRYSTDRPTPSAPICARQTSPSSSPGPYIGNWIQSQHLGLDPPSGSHSCLAFCPHFYSLHSLTHFARAISYLFLPSIFTFWTLFCLASGLVSPSPCLVLHHITSHRFFPLSPDSSLSHTNH